MSKNIYVTARQKTSKFYDLVTIGDARTYKIDLSAWADDNNTITSVTWSVSKGQAVISGESLSSNVATALITNTQQGRSLIKVEASTGSEKVVIWLDIISKDPSYEYFGDYS